ncbi:hypothetical protein BKI52_10495 [marine bacterium AO1-C]|nr:hypothetical protein BKI52_10495 [marine bacterium AO1-C]
MKQEKIVQFISTHFTHQRKKLIPRLQAFVWEDAIVSNIYKEIVQDIDRPINAWGDISQSVKNNLCNDVVDSENLGDISDIYTIVLNPEIIKVEDWDFTEQLSNGEEIHFCQVWINWFLPVFYLFTSCERGSVPSKASQLDILSELTDFESGIVKKVTNVLRSYGYQMLDWEFLNTRQQGLNTDCAEENNASFFECLFSDLTYPYGLMN